MEADKLEVLISTMYQNDYKLLDKMNVQSDATVINQCENNSIVNFTYKGYMITWINTKERGLSRSRNMAIAYSKNEICLLCDDDEVLHDNYKNIIETAYSEIKDANIIIFNINRVNSIEEEKLFTKIKRIPKFKSYSSVHISFRKESIINNGLTFNHDFGTGSCKYLMGEEALFFREIHRNNLKSYIYPHVIADVYYGDSSWFKGYNEHFFYDIGAYLSVAYPYLKSLFKWYYPIRCRKISKMSSLSIISAINKGIMGYRLNLTFDQFMILENNKK